MLQLLTEAKKKKAAPDMDADLDLEMEIDTSMEPEVKIKKTKEVTIDKGAVLKFLKDCDAACRAEICKKLTKMVAADADE